MEPSPERAGVPAGAGEAKNVLQCGCTSFYPHPTHLHPHPSDRQHGTSSREEKKTKTCLTNPPDGLMQREKNVTRSQIVVERRRTRGPRARGRAFCSGAAAEEEEDRELSCVYIPKVSCLDERNEPLFVTRKQETLLRIQSAMKPGCRMFTDSDFLSRPHCPTSPRPHLLQPLHKFSGTKKTKQNKGMRGVHGFGITFKKKMKKKKQHSA